MSKVSKFGTFGGVFVPSILTILGVIMYLRLPMIIGEAGLFMTLGIIIVAHVISVTTGLSVSSIATDKKVEAGGTYYMISRSLGLPIGGTLGLALFVGLSFSVSLYLIGFAESFLGYWGYDVTINTIRIAGTIILMLVTTITFISTSLAIKTQYFIMAAIFLSLLSIVFGNHDFIPDAPTLDPPSAGFSFMLLFGIFFPAVTGFEAGVSMSGDLKDPKKSIPNGTITAILVGLVVYILLAFFFAFTVDSQVLSSDPQVLLKISRVPELVIAGIWGATLSSALGSILGAPRILQATAVDRITPRLLSKGVGKSNEPRNALILTFIIAECGILIGQLDVIARIVSIFFITTYGFLNLSCAFERWTSADFRPSFKTPVWVSLLGATACFLVMIQLDFVAALAASLLLGLLYFYLKRKELSLSSGDAWSGVWASLVKSGLKKLTQERVQSRNWRPNLLLFAGSEERRPHLTRLGLAISGKLGLLSSFELIEAENTLLEKVKKEEKNNGEAPTYFKHQYKCENIYHAIGEITTLYGFSGIEPNTILMGWSERKEKKEEFIELIKGFERKNLNSLFLHYDPIKKLGQTKTIDIWWSGWGRNLALALNLLRHFTSEPPWHKPILRLHIIQDQAGEVDRIYQQVQRILSNYRIDISLKVHNNYSDQNSKVQIITKESGQADLTIIGIPDNSYDELDSTYDYVTELGQHLGTCLFINASSDFEAYTIVSEESVAITKEDGQRSWVLPDLEESRYAIIAEDIRKIDHYGRTTLNLFFEKAIRAFFSIDQKFYSRISELILQTSRSINKASEIEQPYKRSEAILRSRRHFIEKIKELLLGYQKVDIKAKGEVLQLGLEWYLERLTTDINKFPKHLTIEYDKDQFLVASNDDFGDRLFKLGKRTIHPFSKKTLPVTINYREVANYFLRDNRFHFLSILIKDFKNTSRESLTLISDFISYCEVNFQRLARSAEDGNSSEDVSAFATSIVEKMEKLVIRNNELVHLYEGRMQLEYRKNVSQMAHYMERIRVNKELEKKRRKKAFYLDKKEEVQGFPPLWEARHVLNLNTALSNVYMLDFLGYLEGALKQFKVKLNQWIVRESNEPVQLIKASLVKLREAPIEKRQPIIPTWNVDGAKLLDDFEVMSDKLVTYAKTLPDEIKVASEEEEGELSLPLSSLLIYLVEIRLAGPFYDYLETLQDKLMQSSLLIQDQANLSIFNVYNAEEDERQTLVGDLIGPVLTTIEFEQKKMSALGEESFDQLDHLLSELRDSLHVSTLTTNVSEFAQLIRQHKSNKITSRFGSVLSQWSEKAYAIFVSLLYSQSKGVLLAERFAVSDQTPFAEQLLKTIDSVTPDQKLLQKLPHYYTMLFSGRSSISDNFWVKRSEEESQLQLALNRYRAGVPGMITVLGERNAGKTALCKYFCEQNFKDERVYHVFSRDAGSSDPSEFGAALQKATRMEGDVNEIFNALTHGTVLVIHDLELWWERAGDDGLRTIRLIKDLIDTYSHKCLIMSNMNPFAYEVLKKVEALDTYSLSTIRCQHFNAYDLRQLILTRHKSSGILFKLGDKLESDVNEVRLARLFNQIFEYSHGNPGMAMNAWLKGITAFTDKTIVIKQPCNIDISVLHNLSTEWNMIALQLLMHKRVTFEKLCRVLSEKPENIIHTVRAMVRMGVVKKSSMDVYGLNPYIEFLLIKVFHEKEWL
ncbi:MAG: amino acid permease [Cyclobacteriaceae bacterium]